MLKGEMKATLEILDIFVNYGLRPKLIKPN